MREAKYQAQMESSEAAKVVGKHGLATNLAGNSEELRRLLEQSRHLSPRKRDPESDRSDKDVDWFVQSLFSFSFFFFSLSTHQ